MQNSLLPREGSIPAGDPSDGAMCGQELAGLHFTHLLEIGLPGFAAEPRLQHSEIIPWAVMFERQNRGREGVSNLPA